MPTDTPKIEITTLYESIVVTDSEGDKYAALKPPTPIDCDTLNQLREVSNNKYRAIEEAEAEAENEEEQEAFNNGTQHYFIWFVCTFRGWEYANSYTLTID